MTTAFFTFYRVQTLFMTDVLSPLTVNERLVSLWVHQKGCVQKYEEIRTKPTLRFNKAATRGVNLSTLEKKRSSVVLC